MPGRRWSRWCTRRSGAPPPTPRAVDGMAVRLYCPRPFSSSSPPPHLRPSQKTLQNLLKSGFTPTSAALDLFLTFLAQSGRFQTLFFVSSQMTSNGVDLNPTTFSIACDSVLRCGKTQTFEIFAQKNGFLDSVIQHVCRVERNPEKAWSLLHCLKSSHGISVSPSLFSLYSLLCCLRGAGMVGKAREVFDLLLENGRGGVVDSFVCSCVVSGLSSVGEYDMALKFFSTVSKEGCFKPNLVAYTAVLNALCKLGRFVEVHELVGKMEVDGLTFDEVFYSSWICGFVVEGCLMEALRKHKLMTNSGIKPDVVSYTVLIDGLCKEGVVEKVIGLLTEMNKQGLKPNLVTYTAVIRGLIRKRQLEKAFFMFLTIKDIGIELDEVVYATLIDGLCKEGDMDRAFCLLGEMKQKNVVASNVSYNTIINGLCKFGRAVDADHLSKTISCDKFTYTTLLHGYMKEGNINGARCTMKRAEESGVHLDSIMCNVFIKALFKLGAFEDAYQLFKKMPEMGLVANVITYCTIINWCCKVGRTDRILEILDDYKKNSLVCSNVVGYNFIIRSLCKVGMIEMAGLVFTELIGSGFPCDSAMCMKVIEATFIGNGEEGVLEFLSGIGASESQVLCKVYNGVIIFLCQKGCYRAASDLCNFMRKKDLNVSNRSYKSLLKCLICEGNTELVQLSVRTYLEEKNLCDPGICQMLVNYISKQDVEWLLRFVDAIGKKGKTSKFLLKRTISTAMLNALMEVGRHLDAYKLVLESKDSEICLNNITYSAIIHRLCREGCIEKALDLCMKMKSKNFQPNIFTYNSVIHGLCQQGCLLEAFRLFDSLEEVDIFPTVVTYSILMSALCMEGFLHDAMTLYKKMVLKGLVPNIQVYNLLISGYCKFGSMEEAFRLIFELEKNDLLPDSFTVSSIINSCCAKGDIESALKFFGKYKHRGCLPDFVGFLSLIRGLCFKGRMEEARTVIREMLQTQAALELIDKAGDQNKIDSLASFIGLLCDQGSVEEATKVLGEIGSIFYPCKIYNSKLAERISLGHMGTQSTLGKDYGIMHTNDNLTGRQLPNDFDSWYDHISSFCLRGELEKANCIAKEMLLNFS